MNAVDVNELVETHLGLARRIARRWAARVPRRVGADELYCAACEGLFKAARRYRPTAGLFRTFAYMHVWGAVVDYLRGNHPLGGVSAAMRRGEAPAWPASLDMMLGVRNGDRTASRRKANGHVRSTMGESLADPRAERPDGRSERRDLVEAMLRCLPARDREVMRLYYLDGLTMAQAAEAMGVTQSAVCVAINKSLERLRETTLGKEWGCP